jgi:hypothetical protein
MGDPAEIKLMGYTEIVRGHVDSIAGGINVVNAPVFGPLIKPVDTTESCIPEPTQAAPGCSLLYLEVANRIRATESRFARTINDFCKRNLPGADTKIHLPAFILESF